MRPRQQQHVGMKIIIMRRQWHKRAITIAEAMPEWEWKRDSHEQKSVGAIDVCVHITKTKISRFSEISHPNLIFIFFSRFFRRCFFLFGKSLCNSDMYA